ncbi:MAG: hypothetical protein FJZ00_11650, partial [Candidatus Sericytochromatia bacterium]|nr:hypothetical protein [Candidatus Tanganyikabacteria bacterium]
TPAIQGSGAAIDAKHTAGGIGAVDPGEHQIDAPSGVGGYLGYRWRRYQRADG